LSTYIFLKGSVLFIEKWPPYTRRTPARMIIMLANMPATLRLTGSGVNAVGGGWGRRWEEG
jgi:hypothetical protein